MVKISVIVTVYNTANYLEECLNSIYKQTYKDFEVIIVNDGSTDGSQKIIDKFVKKDKRFKSYIKNNSGIADTRNFAINKVNGEYFIFVDGDDSINQELLERINNYFQDKSIDLIKFNTKKIYMNDDRFIDENEIFDKVSGEEAFLKLFSNSLFDTVWSYAYKKSFWDKNKFLFSIGRIHEDFGLIPYVVVKAKAVSSMGYVGYNYFVRENSIMTSNSVERKKKKIEDSLFHFDNLLKMINEDKNISIKTKEIFRSYIANSLINKCAILDGNLLKEYVKILKDKEVCQYLLSDTIGRKIKKNLFKFFPALYIRVMIKR